jgi:hypothetical protein
LGLILILPDRGGYWGWSASDRKRRREMEKSELPETAENRNRLLHSEPKVAKRRAGGQVFGEIKKD